MPQRHRPRDPQASYAVLGAYIDEAFEARAPALRVEAFALSNLDKDFPVKSWAELALAVLNNRCYILDKLVGELPKS